MGLSTSLSTPKRATRIGLMSYESPTLGHRRTPMHSLKGITQIPFKLRTRQSVPLARRLGQQIVQHLEPLVLGPQLEPLVNPLLLLPTHSVLLVGRHLAHRLSARLHNLALVGHSASRLSWGRSQILSGHPQATQVSVGDSRRSQALEVLLGSLLCQRIQIPLQPHHNRLHPIHLRPLHNQHQQILSVGLLPHHLEHLPQPQRILSGPQVVRP